MRLDPDIICNSCARLQSSDVDINRFVCDAFPKGIPRAILDVIDDNGDIVTHTKPLKGQANLLTYVGIDTLEVDAFGNDLKK
jgi:hypothetical protein